jgi:predicted RNase H-like HicB family nuclease
MEQPNVLQFFIQNAPEGGYTAEAIGYSIHTQGETLDETVHNIKEAVDCHFGEDEIKLHSMPIMINFALPTVA